ncbi:hypothetical protein [Pacificoceanicola onchidii]|uniref:hypothetical protein n=1 Tax=Pacificoceanicola onchidii TaxID=2562685 RepID=UPI0010A57260|nr:hypothetical protein [Pacificoceanicola onchidii]
MNDATRQALANAAEECAQVAQTFASSTAEKRIAQLCEERILNLITAAEPAAVSAVSRIINERDAL